MCWWKILTCSQIQCNDTFMRGDSGIWLPHAEFKDDGKFISKRITCLHLMSPENACIGATWWHDILWRNWFHKSTTPYLIVIVSAEIGLQSQIILSEITCFEMLVVWIVQILSLKITLSSRLQFTCAISIITSWKCVF